MNSPLSLKPMQIKLPEDLEAKIERIAEINHLSKVDVIRLCLAQAVPAIEANGITIMPPAKLPTARQKVGAAIAAQAA